LVNSQITPFQQTVQPQPAVVEVLCLQTRSCYSLQVVAEVVAPERVGKVCGQLPTEQHLQLEIMHKILLQVHMERAAEDQVGAGKVVVLIGVLLEVTV
jgi:hypothetical protein